MQRLAGDLVHKVQLSDRAALHIAKPPKPEPVVRHLSGAVDVMPQLPGALAAAFPLSPHQVCTVACLLSLEGAIWGIYITPPHSMRTQNHIWSCC